MEDLAIAQSIQRLIELHAVGKKRELVLFEMVKYSITEIGKLQKIGLTGNSKMVVDVAANTILQGIRKRIKELR